jgi:tyrosinase
MAIELQLNDSSSAARFITYAPSPARLRQTDGTGDIAVTVSSRKATSTGGEAVFFEANGKSHTGLSLKIPGDGTWVDFSVGGKWESPSVDQDDCLIVVDAPGATQTFPCMVRLRKNANSLLPRERNRFLAALARLNASGVYQALRNVHVYPADSQEHRGPYFLPWHRAYLLDLERELQAIDPQVTIPYWKFDEPAPNVFHQDFMGQTTFVSALSGLPTPPKVAFQDGHPLASWVIDHIPSIRRGAYFQAASESAKGFPPFPSTVPVLDQAATLALGHVFGHFSAMERLPHGAAHVSFFGPLDTPQTAPQDPLFFLLHCNVDRLWALWQWLERHRSPGDPEAYAEDPARPKGWKLADTLWPWDGDTQPPRPTIPPPRVGMPASPTTLAPGRQPTLGAMIDFEGSVSPAQRLGFGYDAVPFEEG